MKDHPRLASEHLAFRFLAAASDSWRRSPLPSNCPPDNALRRRETLHTEWGNSTTHSPAPPPSPPAA